MANIVDELVVKLGLDAKEFREGSKLVVVTLDDTKKRTDKVGKEIANSGKDAAKFFDDLRNSAIKFFSVLTVGRGLADFTSSVIHTGAQLARLSQNVGVSADTLARWGGAVELSGGTTQGFLSTIQGLSASLTELQLTGNSSILPYMQMLGVSVADASGKARPLDAILKDIGGALRRLPNRQEAYNIGKMMGLDEGTVNLLMNSRKQLDAMLRAQAGFSDKDAQAALQAEIKWQRTKQRMEAVTRELVIKLLPTLEKLMDAMARFAEIAVPVLIQVLDWLIKLDAATDGWSTKLLVTLGVLRMFGGGAILGGLGALASKLLGVDSALAAIGRKLALPSLSRFLGGVGLMFHSEGATSEEELAFGRAVAGKYGTVPGSGPTVPPPAQLPSIPTTPLGGSGGVRAIRNNNPGNLEFRGQVGAVPEAGSGRFARFGSMAQGVAALIRQLQTYGRRGLLTARRIIAKFAPPGENNTGAYIGRLAAMMGVGPDQPLNLSDPAVMTAMVKGISSVEAGRNFLSPQDISAGMNIAGMRNANGTTISIGQITVVTRATDARGVAAGIRQELVRQADGGMR